jgi:two-component system sensor histidine kinase NreB
LDDVGLQAAIEDLAERARRDGLEVELRVELGDGRADRHSTELETTVYRITQEALTNARKHGGAGHVLVEIQDYERYVHLVVRDDGRGFDPCAKADGFGLHIMGERAELLGGTLEIDSASGRGTQITVDLPTDPVSNQCASYGDGSTAG